MALDKVYEKEYSINRDTKETDVPLTNSKENYMLRSTIHTKEFLLWAQQDQKKNKTNNITLTIHISNKQISYFRKSSQQQQTKYKQKKRKIRNVQSISGQKIQWKWNKNWYKKKTNRSTEKTRAKRKETKISLQIQFFETYYTQTDMKQLWRKKTFCKWLLKQSDKAAKTWSGRRNKRTKIWKISKFETN